MRAHLAVTVSTATIVALAARPAAAQSYDFRQSIPVTPATTLEVTTHRGTVAIHAIASNTMEIVGTVAVRTA